MITKKFKIISIAALSMGVSGSVNGATILSLGSDTTTGADWRTATTAKSSSFDPNGDDIYGSDGYYMGRYNGSNAFDTFILQSTPSFVSSVSTVYSIPTTNKYYSSNAYSFFDDPTSTGDVRGTLFYSNEAHFTFTVSENTNFMLSVLVGTNGSVSPTSVTINQTVGGSATQTFNFSGNNPVSEYVFFDISASAGDVFQVVKAGSTNAGITGVGFEVIPEPSSFALLGLGLGSLVMRRRR
jgi:hypothetical protein